MHIIQDNFTRKFKYLAIAFAMIAVFFFILVPNANATAGIYEKINFQGKLVNTNGTNVANGAYSIVFTLYDDPSAGSNLWDETQSVTVTDGVFQIHLGDVDSTIAAVDFNSDLLYLGVKVGADAEMTPRIRYTAVPYAFNAEKVNGLTVTNNGGNTLNIAANKTLTVSNSLTLAGTDAKTLNIGANNLTFSTSGDTTLTLPTSGTVCVNTNNCGYTSGTNYWQTTTPGGAITPNNSTLDLLIGGDTTASAKFAFLNVAGGTPTASISAGVSGGTYLTAAGNLQTTAFQTLTLGGNTTGAIQFKPGALSSSSLFLKGNGDIGIGTNNTNPLASLDVRVNTANSGGTIAIASISGQTSFAGLVVDQSGVGDIFAASRSGRSIFTINQTAVKVGTASGGVYNPILLNLDSKIDAGDPPGGVNGSMYYNESTDKFRCYQNGAWADCISSGTDSATITTFTADGTWTKSDYSGLKFTQVIVTAGGGGGGEVEGDGTSEIGAGGGGAGGTTIEMIPVGTMNATEAVTVGTGGPGGTGDTGATGSTGEVSSLGTQTTANGGLGGVGQSGGTTFETRPGGVGGAATTDGDVEAAGGSGDDGTGTNGGAMGGTGGASYWGSGGIGGQISATGSVVGSAGVAYGSGGGGAADVDTTAAPDGGAGADGVVVTMNYKSSSGDLAEWYETKVGVEAGDLVAISRDSLEYDSKLGLQKISILDKAVSGASVVGVVSTSPYETIGGDILEGAKRPRPIALAGRVPVKVSEANGKIRAGDLLTLSKSPGVAIRAIKAGQTIGKALEDSSCVTGEACKVLVLVNTSYSTGALLNVAFRDQGLLVDDIPGNLDIGRDISRAILAQMLQDKEDIAVSPEVSEIFTDRITAGLEIITPRVVTQELLVDSIIPVEKDISINLTSDGKLLVNNEKGENALSIDSHGNATFSGTLTAETIRANQIEGLEFSIRNEVLNLKDLLTPTPVISSGNIPLSTPSADVLGDQTSSNSSILNLSTLNVEGLATVSGNFRGKGNGLFEGILTVIDALTANNFIATGISDFFGEAVFRDKVTFSNDIGGEAVIKKQAKKVEIVFDKEFESLPIVSTSVSFNEELGEDGSPKPSDDLERDFFDNGYSYVIVNKSRKGFTIVLNKKAERDVDFTWIALRIRDTKITQSKEN